MRGPVAALVMCAVVASCRERDAAPASPPPATTAPAPAPAPAADAHAAELAALHAFEEQRRAATDFATLPPSDAVLGPDPYRIARLPGGGFVGILRGASAVVALDDAGTELARIAAPRSPGGLAVSRDGDVLVVGDGARELAQFRADGGGLRRLAAVAVDALGMRDVALSTDGKTAYVVEEREGRLLAVALDRDRSRRLRSSATRELGRCHGPLQVEELAGVVAVNCLLDRAIELRRGAGDVARIQHDGPLWGFALHAEADGGVLVAATGVEDHPLERADGGFGYIDSYVYVYRLAPGASQPARLAAINTSALGAITPKWIAMRAGDAGAISVTTAGFASPGLLTLTWRAGDFTAEPVIDQAALPPGTTDVQLGAGGALVAANPLLDAWIVRRDGEPRLVAIASPAPARSAPARIGELLFFTTMLAPWNASEGKRSRFTCETCHHEGYVDGRTHYTGRDRVHATTRPLYGLFNNRPHFSRALDRTMTKMVHAEFRVANRHNGRDPWFALTRAELPWLPPIAGVPEPMSPAFLRQAFMTFLMEYTHRPNPAAADRTRFTDLERAGARAFRARCEACHAARLIADDAASTVGFERWESLVLSPAGPIVWGSDAYAKTGVVPYVHASGARVPSLRRLYKKWPYFTNGSARSLGEVLARFAGSGQDAIHDGAPPGLAGEGPLARLTADEQTALLAFLALL